MLALICVISKCLVTRATLIVVLGCTKIQAENNEVEWGGKRF